MTISITEEERLLILSYLKEHKIPKTVVSAFAGYTEPVEVNRQIRNRKLQPKTMDALVKCGVRL